MDKNKVYSVVDLETTGTKFKNGDRIIQIGCVLIKNGKIFKTITKYINPQRDIPNAITQLTGITNEMVKNAPIFKDVAHELFELLDNTIFVAHNINFDLPFLNCEFQKIGMPILNVKGIDTVELSQILITDANSFRLKDLSNLLDIPHLNPHKADSDALVTAKLFIMLDKKIFDLPLPTLKLISKLATHLSQQTKQYLQEEYNSRRKKHSILSDQYYQKAGIVLRNKCISNVKIPKVQIYPLDNSAKEKLFNKKNFSIKKVQMNLMNDIYVNAVKNTPDVMILDTDIDINNKISYLFPLSFLANPAHKLIISTSTQLGYEKILFKTIPTIEQIRGETLNVVIVKDQQNYLDLNRFYMQLHEEQSLPNQLAILRILVWLTKTTTGDLNELYFNFAQKKLINKINCIPNKNSVGPFNKNDEFYPYMKNQQQNADILLIDHSYLINNYKNDILNGQNYLVVDESQYFIDEVINSLSNEVDFDLLISIIQQIYEIFKPGSIYCSLLFNNLNFDYQIIFLIQMIFKVINLINQFQNDIYSIFFMNNKHCDNLENDELISLKIDNKKLLEFIQNEEDIQNQILYLLLNIKNNFQFLINSILNNKSYEFNNIVKSKAINNLMKILNNFNLQLRQYQLWINFTKKDFVNNYVITINIKNFRDKNKINIQWDMFNSSQDSNNILNYFHLSIFIGKALRINNRFNYFQRCLGLNNNIVKKTYRDSFPYKKHTKLFILNDNYSLNKNIIYENYIATIGNELSKIISNIHYQSVIAFNSKSVLIDVYNYLKTSDWYLNNNYDLLVQNNNGYNDKIVKYFNDNISSTLLCTQKFIKNIKLPNTLKIIVIVDLPFTKLDEYFLKLCTSKISKNNVNILKKNIIPDVTLKLQQEFIKLLNAQSGKSALLVLDSYLSNTLYGQSIQHNLSIPVSKISLNIDQAINQINQFFNCRNEEK